MNADQFRRARDLFERVLDQSPNDPRAWLAQQEEEDEEVLAEVLSLLNVDAPAGTSPPPPQAERARQTPGGSAPFVPEPGARIGIYTIVRELGRGGMGRVYLAVDERLGRNVALKAVAPELANDASERERLRREARAAALLSHPGICTVYALEEIGDEIFIVTEAIEGRTLREEIAAGVRPAADEVTRTAQELAGALAAAHVKDVVHRDLKPENVIRAVDGHLKILDFGLARVGGPSRDPVGAWMTTAGVLVGTPAYMSPEQLNGLPADARTDVFALGVMLYEYACGAHPFDAPTPIAQAGRVLESDAPPIKIVRPDIDASVAGVIERCLRKEPARRYASAAGIERALVHEPRRPVQVRAWWRMHQIVVIGLYLLACVTGWAIKEWRHGFADGMFLWLGAAATIGGVFRAHLVFSEKMNRESLAVERQRAEPFLLVADLSMGAAVVADGVGIAPGRPVVAVLTIALGLGIVIAKLILEPATTKAAFDRG
jgi:hypothetical protein